MKPIRHIPIDLLFAVLIFILLFASYLSYQRISGLSDATNLINRSSLVKINLAQTLVYLNDAETAQRGFLLTKDSVFLEPYIGTFEKTGNKILQLDTLLSGDIEQHHNLASLKQLIIKRDDRLNTIINFSADKSIPIAPFLIEGKNIMDNIRTHIAIMISLEDELLQKRINDRDRYASFTPIFSLVLVISTLLIVIISYLQIRKDQKKVNLLNEKLSNRDKQITAKNFELERNNTELSSFSYVASHDLQEPLRKIQGFSKRIIDKEAEHLSETAKDYFARINAAAQRMQNLIESLLSFSRSNLTEIVFTKTDLKITLEEVKAILHDSIIEKKAIIESVSLPVLNAVPVQMLQLFLNLISNSLKYAKFGVPPHIKITAEQVTINEIAGRVKQNGGFWKIIIQDNGIGFDQKYEHKIFELFQRLHGKTEYEGTGIGLAICKKIVQSHNGTIIATGKLNVGATFTIFLSDNNFTQQ